MPIEPFGLEDALLVRGTGVTGPHEDRELGRDGAMSKDEGLLGGEGESVAGWADRRRGAALWCGSERLEGESKQT